MDSSVRIIDKTEGEFLGVAGGNYRVIISGEETNNSYAVIEMTVPPGGGPPPHAHPDTQEMFYVLEGELEFKTESGNSIVGKGGFVYIPFGGAIHCFKNTSDAVAKLLCTVVPAGLEKVFEEIGVPTVIGAFLPPPELTDERRRLLKGVDEKYGQRTYPQDYFDHGK